MFVLSIPFGSPAYDETVALRDALLRRPLGLQFEPDAFAGEYGQFHLATYNDQWHLLACLVLVPLDENRLKMRQVAVREDMQGKGVGRFLVKQSELFAVTNGYTHMHMHAREVVLPFYEKLGYQKKGERFTEVGIPHFVMFKQLSQ